MKDYKNISDYPNNIPIFPLEGVLLLPKSRLPLNIFEPKYLKMIEDVLTTEHRLIGMIQPKSNKNNKTGSLHDFNNVGCAGRLISFTETEDSRYLITLSGLSRFDYIKKVETFKPYIKAEVDWGNFRNDGMLEKLSTSFNKDEFLKIISEYFKLTNLQTDWESLKKADDELLINSLSILCPFESDEKQALLEAKTIKERVKILITLMEMSIKAETTFGPLQ
jgi:Lon protease-like protein